jgi:hypothetical protein
MSDLPDSELENVRGIVYNKDQEKGKTVITYNTWFSVRQYDAMNDEYVHIVRFPQHHLAWEYINKRSIRNAKVVREYF